MCRRANDEYTPAIRSSSSWPSGQQPTAVDISFESKCSQRRQKAASILNANRRWLAINRVYDDLKDFGRRTIHPARSAVRVEQHGRICIAARRAVGRQRDSLQCTAWAHSEFNGAKLCVAKDDLWAIG